MDELLKLLKTEPDKAIGIIKTTTKDNSKIQKFIKEYRDFDRTQRDGQIERIQIDKPTSEGKVSKMVKIYSNYPQKICSTIAAFVVGKPITLLPSEDNDLSSLIKQIWRVNRLDSKLLEATILKLSETQVAMQFYIVDSGETSLLNKIISFLKLKVQAKEINVKVLNNTDGVMTPYFDSKGNMGAFMWQYQTIENEKTINNVQIWDALNYHFLNDSSGKMAYFENILPHGFDRIPIAYDSQLEPEWFAVKSLIDRYEVAMSKLGDSNDYSGHPILVTEGVVNGMPTKEESGKHFNIPIKLNEEGKEVKGNVRFLEATTAPEANKLELDKLEDGISYGSSVPNLSLEKLKSIGNVAEKTVKLMFLDTEIKAELKRSETKTFIERCINILISGITKTTNQSLIADGKMLYYDIQFNSILPSDLTETVDTMSKAVASKILSRKKGIEILDLVDDIDAELSQIESENKITEPIIPTIK